MKECKSGYTRNAKTHRCRKNKTDGGMSPCKPGMIRRRVTQGPRVCLSPKSAAGRKEMAARRSMLAPLMMSVRKNSFARRKSSERKKVAALAPLMLGLKKHFSSVRRARPVAMSAPRRRVVRKPVSPKRSSPRKSPRKSASKKRKATPLALRRLR